MIRKQLDPRIHTLIRNNVATNHRSFFVLVGDRARDQVITLHHLLSQSRHTSRPNVLWCYKKELGFTTHRKKREAKIKRDIKRGIREKGDAADPFENFVGNTDIRYCYYKDTPKILGRTFGMLILQDFEAITPNTLARTIETVEGGGIVVLMLRTMSSLRQLYSIGMDVHSKYRSAIDPSEPVARFNERFLLSLGANPDTLLLDDELNVLPLSKGKDIKPLEESPQVEGAVEKAKKSQVELKALKDDVGEGAGVADVVKCCKTLDQSRAILTILDILSSSSLSSTVALTAARGRGKSALLGLAIAAAVAHGYSNIFVTSPSPENLKTLFEFLFKGLSTLGYEEVSDWSLQRGTGEWKDVVVRVNIFRGSRQTVQYIDPADSHVLGQAELVVIDEAAAIPLPLVKKLLGPYLVFLSSTINGYEGTGRSLSLKLIQQLRDAAQGATARPVDDGEESLTVQSKAKAGSSKAGLGGGSTAAAAGPSSSSGPSAISSLRSLKELSLNEPIRYSPGDNIESWLNQLLCLDATLSTKSKGKAATPHPSKCELYLVNRDALFSYHAASELFLQKLMALYVSSHYKNSPNDLQLMSDAPSHRLFVLLAPQEPGATGLPEPLAVLQVSLEGNIARQSVLNSLSRGERSSGDLIPWTLSQQFQDFDFASLNGVRVVRLAVNPHYSRSGYGSRALECLRRYFSGELVDVEAIAEREAKALSAGEESFSAIAKRGSGSASQSELQSETISLRDASRMPALLQRLSDRRPEHVDWLGVSYGLTPTLFRFWKRAGYVPLYVRQSPNDLTGEFTTVMLRGLQPGSGGSELTWLAEFAKDFRRRFNSLLGFRFRDFSTEAALRILEGVNMASARSSSTSSDGEVAAGTGALTPIELRSLLSPFDMKRLEAFGNNMLDYSVILDLVPTLAQLYFTDRIRSSEQDAVSADGTSGGIPEEPESALPVLKLQALERAMLLGVGLQHKDPAMLPGDEWGLPAQQGLAYLAKAVRRVMLCLRRAERRGELEAIQAEGEDGATLGAEQVQRTKARKALATSIEAELEAAGRKEIAKGKKRSLAADSGAAAAELDAREGGSDAGDSGDEDEDEDEDPEDGDDDDDDDADAEMAPATNGSADPAWSEAERRVAALQRAREQGATDEDLKRMGLNTIVSVKSLPPAGAEVERKEGKAAAAGRKRRGSVAGRGGGGSAGAKRGKSRR